MQLQIGLLFGFWKEEKKERRSGERVSEKGGEEREERRSRWCWRESVSEHRAIQRAKVMEK